MNEQLETIIINQDIKGLEKLIKEGLDISTIKLAEVFRLIYKSLISKGSIEEKLNTLFIKIFIRNGTDTKYLSYSNEVEVWNYFTGSTKKVRIALSCLQFAFLFYDRELIKYFIEEGIDVNQEIVDSLKGSMFSVLPLEIAYNHNDIDLMQYLMKKGAIVNILDIGNVVEDKKKYELRRLLLESGVQPDQFIDGPGTTAIGSLLSFFSDEYYQYIIDKDENYKELIIEEIKLFISYGADVNTGCPINYILTSEHLSYTEISDLFNIFLNAGLNENGINGKDINGNTPLINISLPSGLDLDGSMYDDTKKILDIGIKLIEIGADINVKNNMGMTALMQASINNDEEKVAFLLKHGADINVKSEMTAYDLAYSNTIKDMITDTKNHTPQKIVEILSNFTLDKPLKYTTHIWDFGSLKKEYENFDGFMQAVAIQFKLMKKDLKELSQNLEKKIDTFLLEKNPKPDYSWCTQVNVNIGWSSLDGLKEWCDIGNNPFDFKLDQLAFTYLGKDITTFGDVIEIFKQEIEIRRDSKLLSKIFNSMKLKLGRSFKLETSKLEKQFYTDTEKFINSVDKIFTEIKKREDFKDIEITTVELEDKSLVLKIVQTGSSAGVSAKSLMQEVNDGDFADIKSNLTNMCDWSIESSFEGNDFRINYLKSNNVKDIEKLDYAPKGFTHILRFYN
ncbi:hypothetical protein JHD48_08015 [Sulfurimonas sp. SAG-AH-194-I05]|nr:ankyrin repeat domain-containing protein [Sulfurimonas sp. SAG-AH-194-I05]MDF1875677.1 hypothetical protein [Sulfurimonas sp. SAG-AH-194-I05]